MIRDLSWLGSKLKVEVQRKDNSQVLEVSLPQHEGRNLDLKVGETVYLNLQEGTFYMGEGI